MESKSSLKILFPVLGLLCLISLFFLIACWYMTRCKGEWQGVPLERNVDLVEIRKNLESDIDYLQRMGPRNSINEMTYRQLRQCEDWITQRWESDGYAVRRETFSFEGRDYSNLEIEIQGRIAPSEIIIVSAQYDTLPDSPGANNNGSGMAILFQLSRLLRKHVPDRTFRLLNFVNEEDPFFGTEMMGSYQYAKRCHERREDIKVMLSMDALGIYTDRPGSQQYPFPFSLLYPSRGNFLAFIGDFRSRKYVVQTTRGFKKGSSFPIEAGVVPKWVEAAGWSDHLSFWKFGYPGIMVTDTGGFRSSSHTTKEDTMEKLNFEAMARIVVGMYCAVIELARKGN